MPVSWERPVLTCLPQLWAIRGNQGTQITCSSLCEPIQGSCFGGVGRYMCTGVTTGAQVTRLTHGSLGP